MALKQPVKTTTNAEAPRPQPHLPPPHTFNILQPLHELLARVDAYHSANIPATLRDEVDEDHHTLEDGSIDIGSAYRNLTPLDPKDLPVAVLDIKARIRTALREVEKLPDVDRTIAQQEDEIGELELRIKKQKEMLRGLVDVAKNAEERVR